MRYLAYAVAIVFDFLSGKDTTSAEMQALKDARHGGEPLPRLCVKALIGTCKDRNCPHPHREPVSKQHKQLLKAAFPRDLEAYVI